MQIALKNSYFSQNLRTEVVKEFQKAQVQDRDHVISHEMGWIDVIAELFSGGAKRKALGHLFDMVQADKANKVPDLTFAEQASNAAKAKTAFGELQKLAYSKFEFVQTINPSHETSFRILDKTNPEFVIKIPLYFEYFETEQALTQWGQIKDGFAPEHVNDAMVELNQLCNEQNTCDKVRHFAALVDLAKPDCQRKFNIDIAAGDTGSRSMSLRFNGKPLHTDLDCPLRQTEDVTESMLQFKGTVNATTDEPVTRMWLSVASMEGRCFSAENRAAAAKIFNKMRNPEVSAADMDKHCDQLVALDGRFKGYKFIFNNKYGSMSDTERLQANKSATKIQAQARGFLTARTKAHKKATVPALKVGTGADRRMLAYKIPQGDGTKKWVRMPGPIPPHSKPAFGTSKVLSHKNDDYVGLTVRDPYQVEGGYVIDPSKTDKTFDTFNENIAVFLDTNKLDCIVQQFRVNEKQFISKNLGSDDLRKLGVSGKFPFHAFQWARLAGQLDTAHAANKVHRDIKPGNMALYDGHVRLFDNETMYEMATKEERAAGLKKDGVNVTTPGYLHPALRKGKYNEADGLKYGVLVDQYSFINSMISTSMGGQLPRDGVFHPLVINSFLHDKLPCNDAKKTEIRKFLLDPLKHPLPRPLAAYFERG